jgi:hypothetical protein
MTFGTARDLSSQVISIPMTCFGVLMNSPHSEFQRISPQKRASLAKPTSSDRPAESSRRGRLSHLYFRYVAFYCRSLLAPLQTHPCAPARAILPAIPGVATNVASKQPEIVHHTPASLTNRQLWDRPNVICVPSILTHAFLRPRHHIACRHFPFSPHSQAPRATERLRPAARRSSASLSRLSRSWFLPLRGHPPRKQTLALGSSLPLAPSGWCALRDSGQQRRS